VPGSISGMIRYAIVLPAQNKPAGRCPRSTGTVKSSPGNAASAPRNSPGETALRTAVPEAEKEMEENRKANKLRKEEQICQIDLRRSWQVNHNRERLR
jgi:hypothetical protein